MIEPERTATGNTSVIEVLRNTGVDGYAVARLRDYGVERLGIRWNGDGGNKGCPTKNGYAVWFLLPDELMANMTAACSRLSDAGEASLQVAA